MCRLRLGILLMAACLLFLSCAAGAQSDADSQSDEAQGESPRLSSVAIVPFAVLNDQGQLVPRAEAANADLARAARLVPAAIAARLIQSGDFEVLELDDRFDPFPTEFEGLPGGVAPVPGPIATWLEGGLAEEIITGSVGTLQTSLVVAAQRYGLRDGMPALLGAAAATAARLDEAVRIADSILESLFPIEADVVPRPIEQLFIVPSTMRLPLGHRRQLQAFALDALGRPLSRVELIYQSSDSSRLEVDQNGVVTGIAPGQATVTVQAVGRPARTSTATATIQVVPPSFGLRIGAVVSGRDVTLGSHYRTGLRITPTVDLRPRSAQAQNQVTRELESAAANPLSYLSNVFSSLLSDGLLTMELEIEPNEAMLFTLDAIQRTSGGFFGTGIGFASPLRPGGPQGVTLRLTVGTQTNLFGRSALPFELNADVIFPTGEDSGTGSHVRVAVVTGFDLFQQ